MNSNVCKTARMTSRIGAAVLALSLALVAACGAADASKRYVSDRTGDSPQIHQRAKAAAIGPCRNLCGGSVGQHLDANRVSIGADVYLDNFNAYPVSIEVHYYLGDSASWTVKTFQVAAHKSSLKVLYIPWEGAGQTLHILFVDASTGKPINGASGLSSPL